MAYRVKTIYPTLQGEGAQAGRAAVFLRFAGCNLWTGREADRPAASCKFCDTDFRGVDGPGGGSFETAAELAMAVVAAAAQPLPISHSTFESARLSHPHSSHPIHATALDHEPRMVVCTGGEPLLQLDEELIAALKSQSLTIAVETNGTRPAPAGIDWLCVSPKGSTQIVQRSGQELKLVYPQVDGPLPEAFEDWDFEHFFLQPLDGPELDRNTRLAMEYCLANPRWRLSVQLHKILHIP